MSPNLATVCTVRPRNAIRRIQNRRAWRGRDYSSLRTFAPDLECIVSDAAVITVFRYVRVRVCCA